MDEQDQGARVGDLNGTEEVQEAQQQGQEQSEKATDDPKVESEDEGTGQDLPESCDNSGDEDPAVTKEQVPEVSIVVQESESVVEEKENEVNDVGSGEEAQELNNEEESLDGKEKEDGQEKEEDKEDSQEEEEGDHNKENHVNGTSEEQNNHFEEELTKEVEEENIKNKEQDSGDIVDFNRKEEDSQQSISELKSKWDSFGKEQSSPPEHIHYKHDNMADTTKTSRFGGTVEKCNQCQKTVYAMERMEVAGRLMHKTCFRCCKCNSPLSVGRFSVGGGELYCMTHYKQAFREKGTYDVFTPDNPIKGKWQNKPAE